MSQWYLDSLEINGGFLPGFSLQFPRGLTCIIGPRGSGKSTLIEALRFGVGGVKEASKTRLELIQSNLGSQSIITIKTSNLDSDSGFTIRRSYGQSPSLLADDGNILDTVDLDRGTFLPLDAYSSSEIEGIADERLGTKRRALLDELRAEELAQIHLSVGNHRRNLEANADKIRAKKRLIEDLAEQIVDMGDARAKLNAMPLPPDSAVSMELTRAAKQCQMNTLESRSLNAALESIGQLESQLQLVSQRLENESKVQFTSDESANSKLLGELHDELRAAILVAVSKLNFTIDEVALIKTVIREADRKLSASHALQTANYDHLKEKDEDAGRSIHHRTTAENAVAQLEDFEKQLSSAKRELLTLQEERKSLKGKYILELDHVSTLREQVARELQSEAGENVRICIRRNGFCLKSQNLLG